MTEGAVRFARYAYPPNVLGYCGPDDHLALFEYGSEEVSDGGLVALARDFEGAWPYLELIASSSGRRPLDDEVVEAYWIGNHLLDLVGLAELGGSITDRFRYRAGTSWEAVESAVIEGVKPSHGFHVFCVYPWVGLMRTGMVDQPLRVLDQCRIRWGEVLSVDGDSAEIRSRRLVFENDQIFLGPEEGSTAKWARSGRGLGGLLSAGDTVALHWDWVCEKLTPLGLARLRRETSTVLDLANRHLARPHTGVLN